ncbi:MAG: PG0541 family transporter-associated protein [Bacteroidota bacterium]
MKAVFIVYNRAHTEKVEFMLNKLGIRGFTRFSNVDGRGSVSGEPRMNTHTWPEHNMATITIVEDHQVDPLMDAVVRLDKINEDVGVRAFVWDVLASV